MPLTGEDGGDAAGHRVLVFAQLKGLLDLVESDVLKPAGVSFLRLDGGVEPTQRFGVVRSRFQGLGDMDHEPAWRQRCV